MTLHYYSEGDLVATADGYITIPESGTYDVGWHGIVLINPDQESSFTIPESGLYSITSEINGEEMSREVRLPYMSGIPTGVTLSDSPLDMRLESTISSLTINLEDGGKLIDEIQDTRIKFIEEHGREADILYLDGNSYLKVKHYLLSSNCPDIYREIGANNLSEIMGLQIQVVPFKKCIRVGYKDLEKEAMRNVIKYQY